MEIGLLYSLIAGLLSILIGIIGWTGNRITHRIDELSRSVHLLSDDMHDRINKHEHRITKAEVQLGMVSNEIFR